MSGVVTGAMLGGCLGGGLCLVGVSALRWRRPRLWDRVVPYSRDIPRVAADLRSSTVSVLPTSVGRSVFGPSLRKAGTWVERVLGGAPSVRRRLDRLGSTSSLEDFRAEQVVWAVTAFMASSALMIVLSLQVTIPPVPALVACLCAGVGGVLARDTRLSRQIREREARMVAEFPTIAELMALSVAAGEGPAASLERVVRAGNGEMPTELARVLAATRTGTPVARALEDLAARTGLSSVRRFAEGLAVSIERGTPLVEVLHAQADDVREASRRALIEVGARKEVAMMIPVVFLVLPTTIAFAFYPGVASLHLTAP